MLIIVDQNRPDTVNSFDYTFVCLQKMQQNLEVFSCSYQNCAKQRDNSKRGLFVYQTY